MTQSLVIAVRFHEGRYHGEGDGFNGSRGWPPSPGRLFQALVAGAARGAAILPHDQQALRWLEGLAPPRIAAPPSRPGSIVPHFVPNNDLDAVGGDPNRVAEIRVGKGWRPHFFDANHPLLYIWNLESPSAEAKRVCMIAMQLYQLGRGVDMAAATATIMDSGQADTLLAAHPGATRSPGDGGSVQLAVPGTLTSLLERRHRGRQRFSRGEDGGTLFRQPPKAVFRHIGYDTPPTRLHFELREQGAFAPRPLGSATKLIIGLRDAAAEKLRRGLPQRSSEIERLIIGRGAGPRDIMQRMRIIPIPSIGMEHTDPSIRRVMVELPPDFPLPPGDVEWAFAGLEPSDPVTGEIYAGRLVSTKDTTMAERYMRSARLYRSVTAVALTKTVHHRRTQHNAGKDAQVRDRQEAGAVAAVVQALRHTGIKCKPESVHVQREPLRRRGTPAKAFASGSRFSSYAMWHAEIRFREAVAGPLVIGDGRYLGLGLMEPVVDYDDIVGFNLTSGQVCRRDAPELIHATRRALMSLARDEDGRVDLLFSGHEPDGRPSRIGSHHHVFIAADGNGEWITRLVVAAPWAVDRNLEQQRRRRFNEVVNRLDELRAGKIGLFRLRATPLTNGDPLIGPATKWRTQTEYLATRNLKKNANPADAVTEDVIIECHRRGLPAPIGVEVLAVSSGPRGGGLSAKIRFHFATAVRGPLLLGRNSHRGGGLFHSCH